MEEDQKLQEILCTQSVSGQPGLQETQPQQSKTNKEQERLGHPRNFLPSPPRQCTHSQPPRPRGTGLQHHFTHGGSHGSVQDAHCPTKAFVERGERDHSRSLPLTAKYVENRSAVLENATLVLSS